MMRGDSRGRVAETGDLERFTVNLPLFCCTEAADECTSKTRRWELSLGSGDLTTANEWQTIALFPKNVENCSESL